MHSIGSKFKTIDVICKNGHRVAQYRKPKCEWGEQTHKLWLVEERFKEVSFTPPPVFSDKGRCTAPTIDTEVKCSTCDLTIGTVEPVRNIPAIVLKKQNISGGRVIG